MIKCLILKNGKILVSEIVELMSQEIGDPDCQLINPFEVVNDEDLVRWPKVTDQRSLKIHSDYILTIVDPSNTILENYRSLTK